MLAVNDVTCLSSRLACILGLLVFSIVGCSDVGSGGGTGGAGAGGAGGEAGVDGMAGSGGTGSPPPPGCVQLFLDVLEINPDGTQSPSEGTTICLVSVHDTNCGVSVNNCVTSNVVGRAVLDLPANQEVVYTLKKDGYGPIVHGRLTDETFGGTAGGPMVPDEQLEALAEQLGTPYPWEGGIVTFNLSPSARVGAMFLPVGSTVDAVGEAFYYDVETERYRTDLEATTGLPLAWDFALGEGGFIEVTPGEQEFEFGGMAGDCLFRGWGWPGGGPNRLRVPVLEGHITFALMRCTGP